MRLAIVGGRDFTDTIKFLEVMCGHFGWMEAGDSLVSGGANGADTLGGYYAKKFNIPIKIFKPEWDKYGKSAGFLRNQTIVDNCDIVLAFWDGVSKGTQDTIEKAKKAKKPTFLIYY